MKKIGLYLDSVIGGGVYQYNLSILNAVQSLSKNGFEIVIAYSNSDWDKYFKQEKIKSKKIPHSILSKIWVQTHRPVSLWRKFSPYLDPFTMSFVKEECNLWIFPSQDIWSYCLPLDTIVTVHDLMHRYESRFPEAGSTKMFKTRERHYSRISKYVKSILVDSDIGKKQMVESYRTEFKKVHTLPYIPPQYIYIEETNINIHELYNLPKKFIFYPAQFWLHKNHKSLIEATLKMKQQHPDIYLVFVGQKKNGYNSICNAIIKNNLSKYIKILNYVPNEHMPELYKAARAMIMPTFFGPTNIPPLEAFALGCPVAVSRIYAMPEQIGDAGLLFNPHSVNEIMKIMIKLWTDDGLADSLRKKGLKKSDEWQQKQFNERFHNIIKQTIGM